MSKKKTLIGVTCACVIILVVFSVAIFARSNASYRDITVFNVAGSVKIERNGKELNATKDMKLKSGDTVEIGDGDSFMRLCMDDDKYLYCDANTELMLQASGNKENSRTTIFVSKGQIISEVTNKLNGNSPYSHVTPNSTMAIRGTIIGVAAGQELDRYVSANVVFEGTAQIDIYSETGMIACIANAGDGLVFENNAVLKGFGTKLPETLSNNRSVSEAAALAQSIGGEAVVSYDVSKFDRLFENIIKYVGTDALSDRMKSVLQSLGYDTSSYAEPTPAAFLETTPVPGDSETPDLAQTEPVISPVPAVTYAPDDEKDPGDSQDQETVTTAPLTAAPEPTAEEAMTPTIEPTPAEDADTTPEPTPAETVTPTLKPAPTEAVTPTIEPTPTEETDTTPEPTLTGKVTPTPEPTPTETVTPTPKMTPTEAVTPTLEPTPTEAIDTTVEPTGMVTPTPSETVPVTPEPTPEDSLDPTSEPTPTETLTPTSEPSPTETVTITPKPEPAEEVSPTSEPTPKESLDPTSEPSPAESLTPTTEPTSTVTLIPTSEPTPTGTVTVTPEPVPTETVTPNPVPTETVTPTPEPAPTEEVTPVPGPVDNEFNISLIYPKEDEEIIHAACENVHISGTVSERAADNVLTYRFTKNISSQGLPSAQKQDGIGGSYRLVWKVGAHQITAIPSDISADMEIHAEWKLISARLSITVSYSGNGKITLKDAAGWTTTDNRLFTYDTDDEEALIRLPEFYEYKPDSATSYDYCFFEPDGYRGNNNEVNGNKTDKISFIEYKRLLNDRKITGKLQNLPDKLELTPLFKNRKMDVIELFIQVIEGDMIVFNSDLDINEMYIVGNEAVIARDRQYEVFTFDPADKTFIYENRSIYQDYYAEYNDGNRMYPLYWKNCKNNGLNIGGSIQRINNGITEIDPKHKGNTYDLRNGLGNTTRIEKEPVIRQRVGSTYASWALIPVFIDQDAYAYDAVVSRTASGSAISVSAFDDHFAHTEIRVYTEDKDNNRILTIGKLKKDMAGNVQFVDERDDECKELTDVSLDEETGSLPKLLIEFLNPEDKDKYKLIFGQ